MPVRPAMALVLALLCGPASAAPESQERLPELTYRAPGAYPRHALERGIEGAVKLSISVSEYGTVRDVTVVEGADHGFAEVAREAAWGFHFEPALDKRGRPTGAVIEYLYKFETDEIAPLSAAGLVRERGTRKYVSNAVVEAVGPDDQKIRAPTTEGGEFRLAGMSPGKWNLTVKGNGLAPSTASVDIPEDDYVEGVLLWVERVAPDWGDDAASEVIEVVGRIPSAEVVARTLDKDAILQLPGSLGDPVRAIQNLPGVARAPFGSGQLLVRGTGPSDTGFYIDGVPLPQVFHFAGLSTVINADILSEIKFVPGNFSARYGDAIGGIVDLRSENELPKKATSYASLDIFQAAAYTSQRLGPSTALVLSARRSYIDAVLNPILVNTEAASVRAPRYYDAQIRLWRKLQNRGRLGTLFMISNDKFRVLGDSSSPSDDLVAYGASFQKFRVRWYQPLWDGWTNEIIGMYGPELVELDLSGAEGTLDSDNSGVDSVTSDFPTSGLAMEQGKIFYLREEVSRPPGAGWLGIRAGIDLQTGNYTIIYEFLSSLDESAPIASSAIYAEPTIRLGALDVTPGVRVNGFAVDNIGGVSTVDPRASAKLDLGPTTISGGAGLYSQRPDYREMFDEQSLTLLAERATHTSVGISQRIGPAITAGITGYYHWLQDQVVGREDVFRFDDTSTARPRDLEPFENEGTGRIYGVETQIRMDDEQTTAWLAGTFGRSNRVQREDSAVIPAEYDQPVILTAIFSQGLPRKWRVGSRARYAAGPPMTDIDNVVFNIDDDDWVPVEGAFRGDRLDPFFAVDVRVDKRWQFPNWEFMTYLEVQNATNRANVEIPNWSEDFTDYNPITGLPIMPALGLRGAW